MRRISLALALVSAFAAGCSGGKAPTDGTSTGIAKGSAGNYYFINIFAAPSGGYIKSATAGVVIDCSADAGHTSCGVAGQTQVAWATTVLLQATATGGKVFIGWAGDCTGNGDCVLTAGADKTVVAIFGAPGSGHTNLTDPALHGPAYMAQTLQCVTCHGPALLGQGIAPSCGACHEVPPVISAPMNVVLGKHFEASGHNSGTCARCHSGDGFRDFIGVDGSSSVTSVGYGSAAVAATTVTVACAADGLTNCLKSGMGCDMCHNSATVLGGGTLNQHKFPSGNLVTMDGKTAICAQCHDGGRPGYEVSQLALQIKAIADDVQLPSADNKTVRAHYVPAASTLFGADAANYAQVTGNIYTAKNNHGGKGGCVNCHDAHSGLLPADAEIEAKCGACHFDEVSGLPVKNFLELEESRQFGFEGDIDGDLVAESIKAEIDGLAAKTYAAIQSYAKQMTAGSPDICVANNRVYVQTDLAQPCNTVATATTPAVNTTEFKAYTPRLLKAVYNYLLWQNDVGAWAHNPRYVVEVLYDTTAQLNLGLTTASMTPVANGKRAFNGHFGAAEDPSPYAAMIYHGGANATTGEVLPTMGFTSGACYQCHGGNGGFTAYLAAAPVALTSAVITPANKVNAMQCSTCHTDGETMLGIRSDVGTVYFPPQKGATPVAGQNVVSFASAALPPGFTVCATCHSGRENGGSVDLAVTAGGKNASNVTVAPATDADFVLGFKNPHYLGAAGMMLGSNAAVMYQYAGKSYTGNAAFWSLTSNGPHGSPHGAACTGCHSPKGSKHTFEIDLATTIVKGTWGGAYPLGGMNPGDQNVLACGGCHAGGYSLLPKITEYEEASAELLTAVQAYASDATNLAAMKAIQVATKTRGLAAVPATATQADVDNSNAMTGVCYTGAANPYFFVQTATGCTATSFVAFNPKLLKAAYNYQWTQKEPGAWAHNEYYVLQAIYDSIVDLGGTPGFTVAAVTDPTTHVPVAGDPLNRGY